MKWMVTKNTKPIARQEIPLLTIEELRQEIIRQARQERRVAAFFGAKKDSDVLLYTVMADDEASNVLISSALLEKGQSYPAISPEVPAFQLFERELHEEFGITPEGHPWLKPVRYAFGRHDKSQTMKNYPFFTMDGEEIHEVAVGPVHAGVIEPGHFRFMCHGEKVYHLEIQLGYQHRNIESLFVNNSSFRPQVAESIAGDSAIAHTTAYANAMEALSNITLTRKAMSIRAIALELERIAVHIGDLGAISNDVAYLMGNAVYGATRTLVINTLLKICGSRFGRGLIRIGGVVFDIDQTLRETIAATLGKVGSDVELMSKTLFDSPSVLSRLERTGVVTRTEAAQIGMVGPAARASGLLLDIRTDHPFGIYKSFPIYKTALQSGDVFARAYIRYVEIIQSIKFILEQLEDLPEDESCMQEATPPAADTFVVSMVEGWRGEIVHCTVTDANGRICRYKIKDPSFNNWFGLALAVRNNDISDFPLCNKSFNLSYCGHDL